MPSDVRPDLDLVPAYVPGATFPGAVKLASNETVHGPLPSVAEAVAAAVTGANRYPDAGARALHERLADFLGCAPENVTTGCGSVALCQQLVHATCSPGDEVVYGWRGFEAYPIITRVGHAVPVEVPVLDDGRLDLEGVLAAIGERTRLVFVCTPNNPTGPAVTATELRGFLDRVPDRVTVAIDEAYYEYVRSSDPADGVAESLARPNVVALRTFSKAYGLAGLRVGYLTGHPGLVTAVAKTMVTFSVSAPAQAAAIASLDAGDELRARTDAVVAARAATREALLALGHRVPETQANFVWLPFAGDSAAFGAHCLEHGVVVRAFAGDGVRVTVTGTDDDELFLAAARAWDGPAAG